MWATNFPIAGNVYFFIFWHRVALVAVIVNRIIVIATTYCRSGQSVTGEFIVNCMR